MPISSQALYFHLGMWADDDGVVEAFSVIRSTGFGEDDLKVLVTKGLVKILNEDLVAFILDWREHNLIRADRKIDSIYKNLLLRMVPDVEIISPRVRADTGALPRGNTTGRPVDGIGKDRLGQVSLVKDKNTVSNEVADEGMNSIISLFEKLNPSYKRFYSNKTQRAALSRLMLQHGVVKLRSAIEVAVQALGKPYAPTITSPIQLEDKLAALGVWYKRQSIKEDNVIL